MTEEESIEEYRRRTAKELLKELGFSNDKEEEMAEISPTIKFAISNKDLIHRFEVAGRELATVMGKPNIPHVITFIDIACYLICEMPRKDLEYILCDYICPVELRSGNSYKKLSLKQKGIMEETGRTVPGGQTEKLPPRQALKDLGVWDETKDKQLEKFNSRRVVKLSRDMLILQQRAKKK